MKRILLAGLLGGITLFVWGFISWTVLHWHDATMQSLPNEEGVVETLRSSVTKTGVYVFPSFPTEQTDAAEKEYLDKHSKGPIGMLIIHPAGLDPTMTSTFIIGILLFIGSALLASILLSFAGDRLKTYTGRVFFVVLLGMFTIFESSLKNWNWLSFPTAYSSVEALDLFVGWFLTGLVIASIMKPRKQVIA